jgi:ABC-2 type transport system ATP-binding protein
MVHIENLSFGYTRKRLFEGLNLDLQAGNIYGLLGKNGAGKTTLLKLICGMRFPQDGECRVLDTDPAARLPALLEDIYLVPEELYIPPISPGMYELLYSPFYPRFDGDAFSRHLEELDMHTDGKLTELSYGQKKKFLLAFGMATNCRLLILDEPTNGLDIPSKSQFRKLLARSSDPQRVVLISTHQVRDLENLIDPIIILDDGKIIFHESMQHVAQRLTAQIEPEEPRSPAVLYSDKVLGGYVVVRESSESDETNIDLETLFNTVIGNREKIREIFRRQRIETGGRQS